MGKINVKRCNRKRNRKCRTGNRDQIQTGAMSKWVSKLIRTHNLESAWYFASCILGKLISILAVTQHNRTVESQYSKRVVVGMRLFERERLITISRIGSTTCICAALSLSGNNFIWSQIGHIFLTVSSLGILSFFSCPNSTKHDIKSNNNH